MSYLNKFLKGEYTIQYLFGRLDVFKKILRFKNKFFNQNLIQKTFTNKVIFFDKVNQISQNIKLNGYYDKIQLDENLSNIILDKVKKSKTFHEDENEKIFGFGYEPLYSKFIKNFIPRVYVDKVNEIREIQEICYDEKNIAIFFDYFGYHPKVINPIIFINFPVEMDLEQRLNYETIKYHYDMESPNAIYFNFYLTDVDELNAPHALIKKTHLNKPLNFTLRSATVDDKKIFDYYDKNDEVIFKLKKNNGFIEDASIYHKNFPALKKKRIMLQIRYY